MNIKKSVVTGFNNKIIFNGLIIISFLVISILSYFLLIKSGYFMGFYDDSFHLKRILELRSSFLHGSILPQYSFNQFHGSEIMTFYPYLNLFPIVIISFFVHSKITLLIIWLVLNTFLSLIFSYYSCYSYGKSKRVSYLFSIIYSTSIFLVCEGQGLNGAGVATSCTALPLVLFGVLKLIKSGKYVELSLGFTLSVYSHVLNSFSAGQLIVVLILINLRKFNVRKIISLIKCGLLTTLLTSVVWIPLITTEKTNRFSVVLPPCPNIVHSYPLQDILQNSFSINYMITGLSIFAMIGVILAVLFFTHLSTILKKLFIVSLGFIYLCSDLFPWKHMPSIMISLFARYQYTSRILIIPQIILSYLFAIILIKYIVNYIKDTNRVNVITLGIVVLAILFQINTQQDIKRKWIHSPVINSNYYLKYHDMALIEPYRLSKSSNFKYLLNSLTPEYDNYYPINSMPRASSINRNQGTYANNKHLIVNKFGYDTYSFRNHFRIKRLALPLVGYNNYYYIRLDHHLIHSKLNKYSQITIQNVRRGDHTLQIYTRNNVKLMYAKTLLFIISFVWILYIFTKVVKG